MIHETRGRYFEELAVGDVYRHAITRTVTDTDNLLFCALTHNPQALHLDNEFGKASIYGSCVVNSIYTLGLVVGVSVSEMTQGTTLGNLGFGDISFPAPVRVGDTLHSETEVISARASSSRPDAGIVEFEHRGRNQQGEIVASVRRKALMKRQPAAGS
ncbi:MAG: dehydratase [Rhodospirillales bacterium 69-11]|nr:MAG: dehydratase [Rhodospirillales bacterium 69-11]